MIRSIAVVLSFTLAGTAIAARAYGQAPRTSRDKVYSKEQAARGATQYAKLCAACHDPAKLVPGKEKGPELVGEKFIAEWQGRPLGALMESILLTMPNDGSAELTEEQTADIVAHMLKANGQPEGTAALKYGAGKDILIVK
jgi:mono/diheme cytochrome c family protein